MLFKKLALAALATEGVLATPFGPFGKLVREAKSHKSFEDVKRDVLQERAPQAGNSSAAAKFKYLSSATTPFQITSLPDVPYDIGEMYGGLIPIKAGDTSRELFFIFQPNFVDSSDETLTIWLNGGPGCSSLEGFFEENGRYVWLPGDAAPTVNPYSWTNMTNMLWVEQPVGTGFSPGTPTATTEEEIAQDFVGFLKNFQTTFGIKNYKIYVTGESYAGRYVPYISSAILGQNDKTNFDLNGALVYDPCIGKFDYVQETIPVVPFVQANQQFFKFSSSFMSRITSLHKSCGFEDFINKYLTFPPPGPQPVLTQPSSQCDLFNTVYNQAYQTNACFNVYEVNQTCPTPADVLDPASGTPYFNRADVKAAVHAPASKQWSECSNQVVFRGGNGGPELEGDFSADPIQHILPQVVEATNRVIVANGDYDMIIITNGTLLAIQNMTWNGQLGFQNKPLTSVRLPNGDSGGLQHEERGLLWTESYKAGHMGPQYAPYIAYRQMQWLLGQIDSL